MTMTCHARAPAVPQRALPLPRTRRAADAERKDSARGGNQAHLRRLSADGRPLQPQLRVGAVDDPLEREADTAADRVMRMTDPRISLSAPPTLSRKCAGCAQEEDELRREANGGGATGAIAPPIVDTVLASPGRALDPATQGFMASRFGTDFSGVRVHTDDAAAQSAAAVGALAYTVGSSIVFGAGQYRPAATDGRRLLAHELAHVVQQRGTDALAPAPLARKADTGRGLRWGQDTTCSLWGFVDGSSEHGEGKGWKGGVCCNTWPLAVERWARMQGWAGAASCKAAHQREIATISWNDHEVEVLCSDTIPTDKPQVIEMSPAAMMDLSEQTATELNVSVTYSGSRIDMCLHDGPGAKSFPTAAQCHTRGCQPAEDSPQSHAGSGWPRT
jgi:hypothetical protein